LYHPNPFFCNFLHFSAAFSLGHLSPVYHLSIWDTCRSLPPPLPSPRVSSTVPFADSWLPPPEENLPYFFFTTLFCPRGLRGIFPPGQAHWAQALASFFFLPSFFLPIAMNVPLQRLPFLPRPIMHCCGPLLGPLLIEAQLSRRASDWKFLASTPRPDSPRPVSPLSRPHQPFRALSWSWFTFRLNVRVVFFALYKREAVLPFRSRSVTVFLIKALSLFLFFSFLDISSPSPYPLLNSPFVDFNLVSDYTSAFQTVLPVYDLSISVSRMP